MHAKYCPAGIHRKNALPNAHRPAYTTGRFRDPERREEETIATPQAAPHKANLK